MRFGCLNTERQQSKTKSIYWQTLTEENNENLQVVLATKFYKE